jgi:hypothetical protein
MCTVRGARRAMLYVESRRWKARACEGRYDGKEIHDEREREREGQSKT